MGSFTKAYDVDDVVQVAYPFPNPLSATVTQRTVKSIVTNDAGNSASVTFTEGSSVDDAAVSDTVFLTVALAAKAIVDDAITRYDAAVNLDTTTTVASASGQTALSLGRVDA